MAEGGYRDSTGGRHVCTPGQQWASLLNFVVLRPKMSSFLLFNNPHIQLEEGIREVLILDCSSCEARLKVFSSVNYADTAIISEETFATSAVDELGFEKWVYLAPL